MNRVRVLFVCSGNTCRSPSAEGVLRAKASAAGLGERVEIDSAGLADPPSGRPPSALAIQCAAARGYDLSGLRTRPFVPADLESFDLIVMMDLGHRAALRAICPEALAGKLHLLRAFSGQPDQAVPDPFGGGEAEYRQALDLIEGAMAGLISALQRDYL